VRRELLDDLSTDGDKIYSDKIATFGNRMMLLVKKYGIDIPLDKMCEVDGWRKAGVKFIDHEQLILILFIYTL
jgi:hypothetical protein